MPSTAKRKFYIAAPPRARIGFLVRMLREKGFDVRRAIDVAPSSRPPAESLKQTIVRSNFVMAVIHADRDNANVYFELGIAVGHGKPVMVFADPRIKDIPTALDGLLIFRLSTEKVMPMADAVDQFVAAAEIPKSRSGRTTKQETQPIGAAADLRVADLLSTRTEQDLIRILSSAITESGAQTAVADTESSTEVDIAVVASDLNSLGLNPLAIEVKRRIRSGAELRRAVEQLEKYLEGSNARAGLVVYLEGLGQALASDSWTSKVASISAPELLNRMREHGFGTVVRRLFESQMPPSEGLRSDGLR